MPSNQRKSSGGLFMQLVKFILGAAIIYAVLRAFGWDLFAVIEWAVSWVVTAISTVADWLSGNKTFQKIVQSPSIILWRS